MHIKYSKKTERRLRMMLKAIMAVVAVALTLWLVWYEFGSSIFDHIVFLLLILMWAILGIVLFLDALGEGGKKPSDEKVDDLIEKMDEFIAEIKLDREQGTKEVKKDGE